MTELNQPYTYQETKTMSAKTSKTKKLVELTNKQLTKVAGGSNPDSHNDYYYNVYLPYYYNQYLPYYNQYYEAYK